VLVPEAGPLKKVVHEWQERVREHIAAGLREPKRFSAAKGKLFPCGGYGRQFYCGATAIFLYVHRSDLQHTVVYFESMQRNYEITQI
jgi:hypothetical protein